MGIIVPEEGGGCTCPLFASFQFGVEKSKRVENKKTKKIKKIGGNTNCDLFFSRFSSGEKKGTLLPEKGQFHKKQHEFAPITSLPHNF